MPRPGRFLVALVAIGALPGSDRLFHVVAGPALHAQEPPGDPAGIWQGTLRAGAAELTIVFHVQRAEDGSLAATMDSPDQGATGIPVSQASFVDGVLTLEVAAVGGRYQGTLGEEGQVLEGTWSQAGQSFPLTVERVDEVEAPSRPQEPEPPFPYQALDVTFTSPEAGIELAGTLTLPQGDGPFPAAVLVSGSGPQNRNEELMGHKPFLVIADHLTREGIAVLRYDDRGVGESGGEFGTATTGHFADDALAAVAWLKGREEVAADAIGLVGHSEGGVVAPMAANRSDDVSWVVLLAGTGLTGEEILYLQGRLIALANGATQDAVEANEAVQRKIFRAVKEEPDPAALEARLDRVLDEAIRELGPEERVAAGIGDDPTRWKEAQIRSVTTPWFRFFLTYDPTRALEELDVPILALNGEKDLQVPPDQNLSAIEAALARGGNPDYTVRALDGLNHLFQPAETGSPLEYARIETTFAPEALQMISDWILARSGDRP